MKKALLITLLFCIAVSMQAQSVVVSNDIFIGKHYANSAVDSTLGIPVQYDGTGGYNGLSVGAYPDSIRVSYSATDTTSGYISFKGAYSYANAVYARDSVGVVLTTASATTSGYTISKTLWNYKKLCGVAYNSKSSGNGVLSARKIWVRVDRFFTASR